MTKTRKDVYQKSKKCSSLHIVKSKKATCFTQRIKFGVLYNASDPTSPIYINLSTLLYSVHLSWLNATKILVSPIDPKLRSLLEDNGDVKDDSTGPDF